MADIEPEDKFKPRKVAYQIQMDSTNNFQQSQSEIEEI